MLNLTEKDGNVILKVKVQPRASKNELAGILGDAVKLRITAPPVEGEANKAVIRFFARLFKLPQTSVQIISGDTSRNKVVELTGVTLKEVEDQING
ncbi:DUF167 domain-containing protein [Dehalobacterium formicoaceticum]|uniref:UPF0235 protein NVS47_03270 n=1 Tax=Dehalobacterium formicoaceticum TaxID=51515 RepID=A0ABT1Y4E2_9FIRM|nr:DUF167 domain-containing protein [Dehalobacterium formicoaceticum]MCR6544541.1 DUF167 domain-containing protein [Dehalobacterium formicoaceticum]